jgi:imidazole glycerol-phosphate synthase subunit HisH
MKASVTVVDYGIGNLYSVCRALEICGTDVDLTSNPKQIEASQRLVLPGVGAFADGMAGLRSRDLIEPIRRHAAAGKPLLGICLGMQMLAGTSTEFGEHEGLGIIPGRVTHLQRFDAAGAPQKIPYVGWAELEMPAARTWDGTVLADLNPSISSVYLVHSFEMVAEKAEHRLAEYVLGGQKVCAAVASGKVIGCQFHPEKSGNVGLSVLRRFLAL